MGPFPRVVLACAVVLAGGCSSNPKPEDVSQQTSEPKTTDGPEDPGGATSTEPENDPPKPAPTGVKMTGVDDQGIPDDFTMMERDCVDLGKKMGSLWRLDLRGQLDPKLSQKKREDAEASIEAGVQKTGDDWADYCVKTLAGKTVDPQMIKCGMAAKDLATFKKCF